MKIVYKPKPFRLNPRQIVLLLAVPLLFYLAALTASKAVETYQLNQQAEQLRQQIADLQARYEELEQTKHYVESPTYVEKVAREELGLLKYGDHAVIIVT